MTKEKTNQYINETELKSLMIRINNKSFLQHLSKSFKRLDKYILKYQNCSSATRTGAKNKHYKQSLEQYIVKTCNFIIKNKYRQLLLITDENTKKIKELIYEYQLVLNDASLYVDEYYMKKSKVFNSIMSFFEPINNVMKIKNINLSHSKRTDKIRIEKYTLKHIKSKSQKHKRTLRACIILISERNIIDKESYERFGEMVLLIIKNILKKPKFSGYTYRDEFYSDSTDKILRYLKNFNHKMISDRTNQEVNAFSYLSQYVHNSILFIINTKNTEKKEVEKYVNTYNENIRLLYNETSYISDDNILKLEIESIKTSLYTDIIDLAETFESHDVIRIHYPADYIISLQEYTKLTKLKELLNKQISVIRKRK